MVIECEETPALRRLAYTFLQWCSRCLLRRSQGRYTNDNIKSYPWDSDVTVCACCINVESRLQESRRRLIKTWLQAESHLRDLEEHYSYLTQTSPAGAHIGSAAPGLSLRSLTPKLIACHDPQLLPRQPRIQIEQMDIWWELINYSLISAKIAYIKGIECTCTGQKIAERCTQDSSIEHDTEVIDIIALNQPNYFHLHNA